MCVFYTLLFRTIFNEFIIRLIKCRTMVDIGIAGYATDPLRINLTLASKENLLNFMLIGQHIILALGAGANIVNGWVVVVVVIVLFICAFLSFLCVCN